MPHPAPDQNVPANNRRRAMLTAAILGLVALAFYVGIFFLVKYRHP